MFARQFMIGTLIIWGVVDIYLYMAHGNAATESATTWHYAYLFAGLTLFTGALMGHFFGQWRPPSPAVVTPPKWRYNGKVAIVCIMIPWLLLDAYGILWNQAPSFVDNFLWSITGHQVWAVFLIGFGLGSLFLPMDEPTV